METPSTYFIKKKVVAASITEALSKEKDAPVIEAWKEEKPDEQKTGFKTE